MDFGYDDVETGYDGLVPIDSVVGDVLSGQDPLIDQIDETVDWVEEDPSRGWVGDHPWTDPQYGVLAPILGETGRFGEILHGVITDPNAPLSENDEGFLQEQQDKDAYYNLIYGGIQGGIDIQEDAIQDLRDGLETERRWNLEYETYDLMNEIAGTIEGWDTVAGEYAPTYPVMPWPGY
jgi:hypothetical protein